MSYINSKGYLCCGETRGKKNKRPIKSKWVIKSRPYISVSVIYLSDEWIGKKVMVKISIEEWKPKNKAKKE